ncbi:MAG: asparagine synthase (glutamine-hydrolyzing) [archaeon]
MCGICGFNDDDKAAIKAMVSTLRHRGPDQEGTYTDSGVSLGHRRLSIIDLSEKGRQPMSNEDGDVWITYNGEIYNYKSIRRELESKGHKFSSCTDTETIVHAYEEYGPDCVTRLNGMFAFAIWDNKNKTFMLARDRLGIKPLYYYNCGPLFAFGSEIKSLLAHPKVETALSLSGLAEFIDYAYTVSGATLFDGIREVPPGTVIIYNGDLTSRRYWEVKIDVSDREEDYYIRMLRGMLGKAVERRLVSDVPLGASLSGGIDSSSVVAFMSKSVEAPIKTFTIGFNDPSDELAEARVVADYCKTDHHEIMVEFEDISRNLPKIVWHSEAPFGRPSMFSGYFLSRGINNNKVIVDLSGSGGDEIFAGYNRYDVFVNDKDASGDKKLSRMRSGYFPDKSRFFDAGSEQNQSDNIFSPYLKGVPPEEHLNAALKFELETELQGIQLFRDDRMSMAHAHEVRVPLLDHTLVEFAMTIPSRLKWHGENKKYIFQRTMKGLLPDSIVNRVKKPFGMPLARYFSEDLLDVADSILARPRSFKAAGIKNCGIQKLIQQLKAGDLSDNPHRQLLFFTTLEILYRIYFENEKPVLSNFL